MKKKLYLVSLGCNKNLVDSEIMLGKLGEYSLTNSPEEADVIIINTCGFIGPAKEESLETIFDLHEVRKKGSLLVVAGCLSERYKDELAKEMPEVDCFTGVGDYSDIEKIISSRKNKFTPRVYLQDTYERVITGSNYHAYIKLSEGCNQQCSFCAIPGFKGKLQSRTVDDIVKEVKYLCSKGFYDFSFLSQDSSSYLRDQNCEDGLIKLIDAIEKIDGVKSARILYLYPSTTSNALIERIIESPLFHNYFDMPIQHIDDSMLKKMRRGAGKKRILEQLELMRKAPNSFLRTSIIAGHPGENEFSIKEILKLIKTDIFDRITLFAYSDEEDTPAFKMKDKCSEKKVQEYVAFLEDSAKESFEKSLQNMVGQNILVVVDGPSSEHDLLMGAKALSWAPQIDGEILINESDIGSLEVGKTYEATISEKMGDKLIATVTKIR